MTGQRNDANEERPQGEDSNDGLVEAIEETVEYRVRTRRGEAHPAPGGDLAWLSAAVDDGLAKAEEPAEPQDAAS